MAREAAGLPATYRKLQGHAISANFRAATAVVSAPLPRPSSKEALVRVLWAGVNASDLNWTNAKYNPNLKPPYDTGFELVGEVVAVGDLAAKSIKLGDYVASMTNGAFSEYVVCHMSGMLKIPSPDPAFLTVLVSGATASVSLTEVGCLASKETVLVTAAAGGTGIFAVQLAKLAGNHVIATCSSDDKAAFLKSIGCDRVINYKTEDLGQVLKKEYPNGINLIYESVGGRTFDACLSNIAVKGRLIVIGSITGYKDGSAFSGGGAVRQEMRLLTRSASLRGFLLTHYPKETPVHIAKLLSLHSEGKLKLVVDRTPFVGLDKVADALDFLYSGRNVGKVVVQIAAPAKARM